MNKISITLLGLLFLGSAACHEADREMFTGEKTGVYFKMKNLKADSTLILRQDTIVYTFAYDPEEVTERIVCVPVEVMGDAADHARTYRVEIQAGGQTTSGVDFEPIAAEQNFPAGKTIDSLRVVWKRTPDMQKEVKKLSLRIVTGGELGMGVEDYLYVCLQASDIIEKPAWWDDWEQGFGAWHPTKLREWVKIWGRKDLDMDPWMLSFSSYPQESTAIVRLKDLFEREAFYDENGVRLVIPANL